MRLKFCSIFIQAWLRPQMLGVKYGNCGFKGTFETFSFDGTWNSFHTAEETLSEQTITFRGNILYHSSSYFESQSVLFWWSSLCVELNINVLFRLGFRNSLKARTPLEKWAMDLTKKTLQSAIMSVEITTSVWGKTVVKKYKRAKKKKKTCWHNKILTCSTYFWTGFVGLQGFSIMLFVININYCFMRNAQNRKKKEIQRNTVIFI